MPLKLVYGPLSRQGTWYWDHKERLRKLKEEDPEAYKAYLVRHKQQRKDTKARRRERGLCFTCPNELTNKDKKSNGGMYWCCWKCRLKHGAQKITAYNKDTDK